MEKKNMVLLTVIAVATLLVAVVGATFAYFTASINQDRTEEGGKGQTQITTGKIASTTVVANVDGEAGKFTAENVYPGHKEVAALKITATSDNTEATSSSKYNITYNVTKNELGQDVKVTLYRSETPLSIGEDGNFFNCTATSETVEGEVRFKETCDEIPTTWGTAVATKTLSGATSESLVIANESIDLAIGEATKTYNYYVVVEFVNSGEQNALMGKALTGTINVEPAA